VRDPAEVRTIVDDLVQRLAAEGVEVEKQMPSPLPGRKGNREFLFLLRLVLE
jgi:predicted rRNA methylase YqxC with S4 and FtsJ domains